MDAVTDAQAARSAAGGQPDEAHQLLEVQVRAASFKIECLVLSIIGGILGVGLGWIAKVIAGVLIPQLQLRVGADAVVLATAVSSFVGTFFGLYPASPAARMKPIDALRFE